MDANKVISQILRLHSEYSEIAAMANDPVSFSTARTKAEAMNELLNSISDSIIDEKKKAFFDETIQKHFDSFSRGLFWNRDVNLEE